ncbi:MAG: TlpA family protein disulfide reductase [Leptospiraceae bacterium]|nr:TlpA family protein disulfide reductase [Leptospiraceae bacterium]
MKKTLILLLFLSSLVAQEAPSSFMLIQESNGEPVFFKDYVKKQPLIVNFWATYCVPCKKEMPEIQKLARETGKAQLIFISIDSASEKEKVKAFLSEAGISETVLLDIYQVAAKEYLPSLEVPATFLIGSDGRIKFKTIGFTDKTIKELRSRIPKLK